MIYDDEYLIYLSRNHQKCASNLLYDKYKRITYSIVNKYDISITLKEEMVQDAMTVLVKSVPKYNSREYRFFPFAYTILIRRVGRFFSLLKRYDNNVNNIKEKLQHDSLSLCDSDVSNVLYMIDLEKRLSGLEYSVIINRYVYNYNIKKISEICSVNEKKVYNILYNVKKDMIDLL